MAYHFRGSLHRLPDWNMGHNRLKQHLEVNIPENAKGRHSKTGNLPTGNPEVKSCLI
jgi:hypothetical protein